MRPPIDGRFQAGDVALFVDRKEREYMRILRPERSIHIRRGTFTSEQIIGVPEGSVIQNSSGEPFLVLRPTYAQIIPNLPRRAQVIYPKDIGPLLVYGDIYPGARVLEVGIGPGATTIALLRAVGREGEVVSYELREDFAELARQNVGQYFGEAPNWTIKLGDAVNGFTERGIDRMVVDLAEPWTILHHAWRALRPGGVLIGYVPTVLQVKHLVDEARRHGFGGVQVIEPFLRGWHVKGLSIRPEHRMVAHTGFIVLARRMNEPVESLEPENGDDSDDDEVEDHDTDEDDDLR